MTIMRESSVIVHVVSFPFIILNIMEMKEYIKMQMEFHRIW